MKKTGSPKTNVALVKHMMERSSYGILAQAFIMEAIMRYAKECSETRLPKNGVVCLDAWQGVAKEILNTYKVHRSE